jgi:hypothetical protein
MTTQKGRTLRQRLISAVGEDLATPNYFRQLGYDEGLLEREAPLVYSEKTDRDTVCIYSLPTGYHVSTNYDESYSDDPVADGYVEPECWARAENDRNTE